MRFNPDPPIFFTYICKFADYFRPVFIITGILLIVLAIIPWKTDSSLSYKEVSLPNNIPASSPIDTTIDTNIDSNIENESKNKLVAAKSIISKSKNAPKDDKANQNIKAASDSKSKALALQKNKNDSKPKAQTKHQYIKPVTDMSKLSSKNYKNFKDSKKNKTAASSKPSKVSKISKLFNKSKKSKTTNASNTSKSKSSLKNTKNTPKISKTTKITKSTLNKKSVSDNFNWKQVKIRPGDNLTKIFNKFGIQKKELYKILSIKSASKYLKNIRPGQSMSMLIEKNKNTFTLKSLKLDINNAKTLNTTKCNNSYKSNINEKQGNTIHKYKEVKIQNSLFGSAKKHKIPQNLIMQLIDIFSWDIDFALDVRKNDSFKILYEEKYINGKKISTGNILAATFHNKNKTYTAIRYKNAKNNTGCYYSPNGFSMQKAFLRTPVKYTRISSRFTYSRKHPILHKIRAHKGVDYVAPRGTPIKAAGNGKVIHIGRKGGYGKAIVLKHGRKYTTLYGHLSRYASKLRKGSVVKQGQTIGYVGSTGLASGPHLHYEFRENGIHKDPLKVKLPKSNPIPVAKRKQFKAYANKILAELNSFSKPKSGKSSLAKK